ncbi:unnamed protein product [Penicillium salamii]|uniref:F-box domain-containing protein n=1 Tax=Penicillium salamii TaxID=1612424 RepID=A0A9W4JCJ6_9EURO|nr:unnamed protein product [Penicillium salamii]CAG7983766.1 unnamed protein product [Penicillium salamii]CAG8054502.1 unnamed protein product [Penicillium salamii]CAG8080178.1 unnamed protein product [Penicillium salamii]CAG8088118.1 unnamed protein product [Penicillium salamii]
MALPHSPVTGLMTLPSELHLQISTYLSYPDALALKHSSRHFYSMVYTGVHLKVDWLVERFESRLECPMEKCSFRTDESFCNDRVRGIMERRRWHLECKSTEGGCIVVDGQTCRTDVISAWFRIKAQGKRKAVRRVRSWGQEGTVFLLFLFTGHTFWRRFMRSLSVSNLDWIHGYCIESGMVNYPKVGHHCVPS